MRTDSQQNLKQKKLIPIKIKQLASKRKLYKTLNVRSFFFDKTLTIVTAFYNLNFLFDTSIDINQRTRLNLQSSCIIT